MKANYGGLDSKQMHIFINRPYNTRAVPLPLWPSYEPFSPTDLLNGWKTVIGYEVAGLCALDPVMAGFTLECGALFYFLAAASHRASRLFSAAVHVDRTAPEPGFDDT